MSRLEEALYIIIIAAAVLFVMTPAAFLARDTNAMIHYENGNEMFYRLVHK